MGSGPSRGKKVAPACVSEVNGTHATSGVTSPKQDGRHLKPLHIHALLRTARNRAQPDSQSEGRDSDWSGEDEDVDGELGTVLAGYEGRETVSVKKSPPKKTFTRSKTYGLCHLSREDTEDERSSAPGPGASAGAAEPRGSRGGSRDVNKGSKEAFLKTHTPAFTSPLSPSSQGFLTRGALLEAAPTPEKQSTFGSCHSSSLTTPVILYDGLEEELMDTIEREFS